MDIILQLLQKDARLTPAEIAKMTKKKVDEVKKKIKVLSGGERARLVLAGLLLQGQQLHQHFILAVAGGDDHMHGQSVLGGTV